MSFEKEGKGSGTRRKARECALQMLFAIDLVGPDLFSATRYWSELGFDEVHRGSSVLVSSFRDQVYKLEKTATDFRSWLKRTEPLEKTNSRFERAKDLQRSAETLQTQYRNFVDAVVQDKAADSGSLRGQVEGIRVVFDRLINDIETHIATARTYLSSEDKTQLKDLKEQGPQVFDRLLTETLPQIEKMIETVRPTRAFADRLSSGSIERLEAIDEKIRTRAEHWRIERMAIVDRNVLRLAVYEFLFEDTPHTVAINEALEIARRFSTFEATQFINGILDAIKLDLEKAEQPPVKYDERSQASSS
jgi:transcription antitermination factor NusB